MLRCCTMWYKLLRRYYTQNAVFLFRILLVECFRACDLGRWSGRLTSSSYKHLSTYLVVETQREHNVRQKSLLSLFGSWSQIKPASVFWGVASVPASALSCQPAEAEGANKEQCHCCKEPCLCCQRLSFVRLFSKSVILPDFSTSLLPVILQWVTRSIGSGESLTLPVSALSHPLRTFTHAPYTP